MPATKFKPGQLYTQKRGSTLRTFKVDAAGKPRKISETKLTKPKGK